MQEMKDISSAQPPIKFLIFRKDVLGGFIKVAGRFRQQIINGSQCEIMWSDPQFFRKSLETFGLFVVELDGR